MCKYVAEVNFFVKIFQIRSNLFLEFLIFFSFRYNFVLASESGTSISICDDLLF